MSDRGRVEPAGRRVPSIGCGLWVDRRIDPERLGRQLEAIAPRHLDVLVDLRDPDSIARMTAVLTLAERARIPVWLYAICDDHAPGDSLDRLAQRLDELAMSPAGVMATPAAYLKSYQPDGDWPPGASPSTALAQARLRLPGVAIGGGTPTYFTELNRCRPDPGAIDFITHAISPIVHAADDRSVMETLESVPAIVASCRALAPDVPYRITTTAIGAWTNPYGQRLTPNDGTRRVTLSDADPRQRGLFAAAWTLGFVARATQTGVDALTLSSLGPPFDLGDASDDSDTPLHYLVAELASAAGSPLLASPPADGRLATLAFETAAATETWLIANLSDRETTFEWQERSPPSVALLDVDRRGFAPRSAQLTRGCGGDALSLPPLAIGRLRFRR